MRKLVLIVACFLLPPLPLHAQDQFLPALHAQLAAIERGVQRVRQLDPLAASPLIFPSPAGLEAFLRERITRYFPPERFQADLYFYRALDLAPADIDLESLYFEFIQEWIGGYYDTDQAAMSIIPYAGDVQNGLLPIPYQVTYAHEYVHALQDQHFDLERLISLAEGADNRDQRLAIHALIEGDANTVMGEFVDALLDRDAAAVERAYADLPDPALSPQVPAIMVAATQFPYRQGYDFVAELMRARGWEGVNEALRDNPPSTTEQIYHPGRYLAGEGALPVEMPDLSAIVGAGWRMVYDGPVGEFYLRQHLYILLGAPSVNRMAEGWGGDRLQVFAQDDIDHLTWVMYQRWDTSVDADQFARGYRYWLERRYRSVSGDGLCWIGKTSHCIAQIGDDETRISHAASLQTARALLLADE